MDQPPMTRRTAVSGAFIDTTIIASANAFANWFSQPLHSISVADLSTASTALYIRVILHVAYRILCAQQDPTLVSVEAALAALVKYDVLNAIP